MRTPEKRRNPPRVTMKDGILSRAISVPWRAPMTPQQTTAARIAAHHGQSGPGSWTSLKAITPPRSATAPTERSISAEEQDHGLSHRQHHVHGAQPEDVDEVARPQEGVLGGDDLEDDGDDHDGQDHGQDTAVAAADPEPPSPQVLAKRLGDVPRAGPGPRRPWRAAVRSTVPVRSAELAGDRGQRESSIRAMASALPDWWFRPARTAARRRHRSSCTRPRSAGRSPRPAPRRPSAPGTVPRSGPPPRRRRSGCGRPPSPPARGPGAARPGPALSGSAPPRGRRWARPAAPPWSSTSPPWPLPPTAADLPRASPPAGGSSAPWSPARCSGSRPPARSIESSSSRPWRSRSRPRNMFWTMSRLSANAKSW